MGEKRQFGRITAIAQRTPAPRRRPPGEGRPSTLDWPAWVALIERQRRAISRDGSPFFPPQDYFVRATCVSFQLDGIATTEQEVIDALTPGTAQRKFRSRAAQRVRNHVGILLGIERAIRLGISLKVSAVLRWYTSISSGLAAAMPTADRMSRVEQIVNRVNSPQLRLQPALMEIARQYSQVLSDPLFPSFNGILSRLLLRYHLGRCALPYVVLDDDAARHDHGEQSIALALLNAIDRTYQDKSPA